MSTPAAEPAPRFRVETDLDRIDLDVVHRWLSEDTYWASGRSRETMRRAAEGSINFGVLDEHGTLCGYARVVTDRATFAWVCDVYVPPSLRGHGFGSMLSHAVVKLLAPMGLRRTMLSTQDAHGLYEKVGFGPVPHVQDLMMLRRDR